MTTLSPERQAVPLVPGLPLWSRGKVADTYAVGDSMLLPVRTDGGSIFDFVLPALFPGKGIVLNLMNHYLMTRLAEMGFKTHLIAAGAELEKYGLPEHLLNDPDLLARTSLVERLRMTPVEFIMRACLTGGGLTTYLRNDRVVCGHRLPHGLQDGDRLPFVLDTPTTKAAVGHDTDLNARAVRGKSWEETLRFMQVFQALQQLWDEAGMVLADFKGEAGRNRSGELKIGDEITPDSMRLWDKREYAVSRRALERAAPAAYDKQVLRLWGVAEGIDKLNPEDAKDVERVHGLTVPDRVIEQVVATYRYVFWRLVGVNVEKYAQRIGIDLPMKRRRITIVTGSDSDIPVLRSVYDDLAIRFPAHINNDLVKKHVISCHRHPHVVSEFCHTARIHSDVIIAAGSKALALPGVMDSWIYAYNQGTPVIGVALGLPGSPSFEAAKLSISELPGTPVIMDELRGEVYAGADGFRAALLRAAFGEFPPQRPRPYKPTQRLIEWVEPDFEG